MEVVEKKTIRYAIILILSVFVAYANSFDCPFHFDDQLRIVDNENIKLEKLSINGLKKALFSGDYEGTIYRPVSALTLAINYHYNRLNTFGYHLVNVSAHAVTTLFLFLVILHTIRMVFPTESIYYPLSNEIAFFSTILWALNPIHTQAVTYIVQRMAVLAGLFSIMSLYFFILWRISFKSGAGAKTGYLILSIFCCLLAFGSKENAIVLPFAIFVYEAIVMKRSSSKEKLLFRVMIYLALLAPVIAFGLYRAMGGTLDMLLEGYANRPFTPYERLISEPRALIIYIAQLFYPIPQRLSLVHDFEKSTGLVQPPETLLAILLVFLLFLIAIAGVKRYKVLSLAIFWFFMFHSVESSFLCLELFFEHRNYTPSMFIFVPLVTLVSYILLVFRKSSSAAPVIIKIFAAILPLLFGFGVHSRNLDYKSPLLLWKDAAEKAPRSIRGHTNYCSALCDLGRYDEALKVCEKAVRADIYNQITDYGIAYYNIGYVYMKLDDLEKSKINYIQALRYNAKDASIFNNLGAVYGNMGDYSAAERFYLKGLSLNEDSKLLNRNIGLFYLRHNRPQEAFKYLTKYYDKEKVADAALYVATCLNALSRYDEAVKLVEKYRNDDPVQFGLVLAWSYYKMSDKENLESELVKLAKMVISGEVTLSNIMGKLRKENWPEYYGFEKHEFLEIFSKTLNTQKDEIDELVRILEYFKD